MHITTYKPDEIDIKELAAFIFQEKNAELERRNMSLEALEARLHQWSFISYVLARSGDHLIGYTLLFRIGDSDMIVTNPGSLLGYHPVAAPQFDQEAITAGMLEEAKKSVVEAGFDALYIDIPWDPAAPPESSEICGGRYGKLGFEVIQQMLQMNRSLPAKVSKIELPGDIQLAQIQSVDAEALYQCHHVSYLHGDARYYFQMDEAERRDDFERIYAPNIREHPASLILTKNGRILGYCLLFGQADFSELMSLAVHPDYRRQGYGRLLMDECIKKAGEAGHEHMQLIVDINNQGAVALYRQCGFKETGGNMTFKWKQTLL